MASAHMSQDEFCKAIDVTEHQFEAFMHERKRGSQEESKVFHNVLPFLDKAGQEMEQEGEGKGRGAW
jgi:hypothetical protein